MITPEKVLKHENIDTLGLYLRNFANRPLLGAQEEMALAKMVDEHRQTMRQWILCSGRVQRAVYRLLKRVERGHMLPANVVNVPYRDRAANDLILRQLTPNLRTIEGLLSRLDRDFMVLVDRSIDDGQLQRVRRRLLGTRKRISALLEETPLRTQHLLRLARGVLVTSRRVNDLHAELASGEANVTGTVTPHGVLASICRTSWESPRRLCRQARTIQRKIEQFYSAKHEMVEHNLRLVVYLARNYTNSRLNMLDLIQEGNLGLIEAVDRFDYRRGCRFSTYATWWIRQAMTRAIAEKSGIIRLPHGSFRTITKLRHLIETLSHESARLPTDEEIVGRSELPLETLRATTLLERAATFRIDDEHLGNCEITPAEGEELGVPDAELLKQRIHYLIDTLSYAEQEILKLRYGLSEDPPYTLQEIGRVLNLSSERIRQLESRAIAKLRNPDRAGCLIDFL